MSAIAVERQTYGRIDNGTFDAVSVSEKVGIENLPALTELFEANDANSIAITTYQGLLAVVGEHYVFRLHVWWVGCRRQFLAPGN